MNGLKFADNLLGGSLCGKADRKDEDKAYDKAGHDFIQAEDAGQGGNTKPTGDISCICPKQRYGAAGDNTCKCALGVTSLPEE